MAQNRLHLDFSLESNTERTQFVQDYVKRPEFITNPLTERELNTIADYILWGRNASGLNDVQEKRIQIATKHGNWDNSHPTESLDALIESPTFNESQLASTPTHYTKPSTKFSRAAALADAPAHLQELFRDLFRRIDEADLRIEEYELLHGKRTTIREPLLSKFTENDVATARNLVQDWSNYRYLKARHELVELRREQYTLKDSYCAPILKHTDGNPIALGNKLEWDVDIPVLPLGLKCDQTKLVFREKDDLIPEKFSEEELQKVSQYYWARTGDQTQSNNILKFDFRDLECVYELFMAFYDTEDAAAAEDIEGNARALLDTLNYYIQWAELTDLQQEILNQKIRQTRNQDIANYVNKKYEKNYTANYISTLFRQKIIPEINTAARLHEEIISKIYFPEEFKTCSCCGRTYLRTAEFFVRKARSKDGLSSRCKQCDKHDRAEKKVIELVKR